MSTETQVWYRVSGFAIDAYDVVRTTDKTVTYLDRGWNGRSKPTERRSNRVNSYEHWFESEAEAVEHVRSRLVRRESDARLAAERAITALAAFNAAHPLPATEE